MRVRVAVQAADSVVAAVVAEEGQLEQAGEQELLQEDDCALRVPSVKLDEAAEAGQDQGQGQDQESVVVVVVAEHQLGLVHDDDPVGPLPPLPSTQSADHPFEAAVQPPSVLEPAGDCSRVRPPWALPRRTQASEEVSAEDQQVVAGVEHVAVGWRRGGHARGGPHPRPRWLAHQLRDLGRSKDLRRLSEAPLEDLSRSRRDWQISSLRVPS